MRNWLNRRHIQLIEFRISGRGVAWISTITLLAVLITISAAVYLAGISSEKWPQVPDFQQAFEDENWPEIPTPEMHKAFLAKGGLRDEMRGRLEIINDNRERDANREELNPVTDNAERKLNTPARAAQWDWVDSHGCAISGWNARDTQLVALLVRKGVWDCSGWRRAAAATPLVQNLGLWKGLAATVAILALMIWLCWILMQWTARVRLDGETNRKVYLSRLVR